jgi:surface protein
MFREAISFNKDIGNWNTSKVEIMSFMFQDAWSFNQDIGNWNTTNVKGMTGMFRNASSFNQDLSRWCVYFEATLPSTFKEGSALTDSNLPIWGTCPGYDMGDNDVDGVPNYFDQCPNTSEIYFSDSSGCQVPPLTCLNARMPGTWKVKMYDSYGDGWQNQSNPRIGLRLYIDSKENLYDEFGLCSSYNNNEFECTQDPSYGEVTFQMPSNVNFVYWVYPGDAYSEQTVEIIDPNGELFLKIYPGTPAQIIQIENCN